MHFPCQIFVESDFSNYYYYSYTPCAKVGPFPFPCELSRPQLRRQGSSFSLGLYLAHSCDLEIFYDYTYTTREGHGQQSCVLVTILRDLQLGLSPSQKELSLHYQEHQLIINAASQLQLSCFEVEHECRCSIERGAKIEGRTRSLFIVHLGSMEGMTEITPRMTQCLMCCQLKRKLTLGGLQFTMEDSRPFCDPWEDMGFPLFQLHICQNVAVAQRKNNAGGDGNICASEALKLN